MSGDSLGYQLIPLEEGPRLDLARAWASRRRAYVHHSFDPAPGRKQIGVFAGGRLLSVVTVEHDGEKGYLLSVTSARKSDLHTISSAVYQTGWSLFDKCNASRIYTMSPTLSGHVHRGSRSMCEMCGLTPTGHREMDAHGNEWHEYELTRADWLRFHQKAVA